MKHTNEKHCVYLQAFVGFKLQLKTCLPGPVNFVREYGAHAKNRSSSCESRSSSFRSSCSAKQRFRIFQSEVKFHSFVPHLDADRDFF